MLPGRKVKAGKGQLGERTKERKFPWTAKKKELYHTRGEFLKEREQRVEVERKKQPARRGERSFGPRKEKRTIRG